MHHMKSKPSRSIYRMRARLVAVLAAGVSLTWAPWAQAAGTVQVSVKNGNLEIRGDDASNCIEITGKGGTGEYAIGGCGSTLINGGAISGVIHDIIIDMRGGDDQVTIDDGDNNIAQDDLKITTNPGPAKCASICGRAPTSAVAPARDRPCRRRATTRCGFS